MISLPGIDEPYHPGVLRIVGVPCGALRFFGTSYGLVWGLGTSVMFVGDVSMFVVYPVVEVLALLFFALVLVVSLIVLPVVGVWVLWLLIIIPLVQQCVVGHSLDSLIVASCLRPLRVDFS